MLSLLVTWPFLIKPAGEILIRQRQWNLLHTFLSEIIINSLVSHTDKMKCGAWAAKGGFHLNMDSFFETMQKIFRYFIVNDKYMEM